MRLKFARTLLFLGFVGNLIFWHKIWWLFTVHQVGSRNFGISNRPSYDGTTKFHRRISRLVTIVVRQFENFENDVTSTVDSVLNYFPEISVIIVCDDNPYPPLEIDFSNDSMRNVRLVNLQPDFNRTFEDRNPLYYVRTKFVLFVPDATRISSKQVVQETVNSATRLGAVTVPIGKTQLSCLTLKLRVKEWSLRLVNNPGTECDAVVGRHVTMMESKILRKLSDPFLLPFTDALYLQTKAAGVKIHILNNHQFNDGKPLFRSQQSQSRMQQLNAKRERSMFEKFGIKKVTRTTSNVDWYGCSRETPRCFGSIVNGVPSYLHQNRHTPPCCLAGLRKVGHHVFEKLDEAGIRYWLEGWSLLGAMKNADILPWDHRIDVGVNRDDIERSPWLSKARNKPVIDNHGYVWEKATEGEFFKVQYSRVNRLHVNILPFYRQNGTMTRDAWFLKNRDFPEHYLHPMSSIEFAGRQVPSPNNIRDFLETKYYTGVIENSELPGKIYLD